jgi:hypothetical protein
LAIVASKLFEWSAARGALTSCQQFACRNEDAGENHGSAKTYARISTCQHAPQGGVTVQTKLAVQSVFPFARAFRSLARAPDGSQRLRFFDADVLA